MDRRIHDRYPTDLQVRVTELKNPEFSASGQVVDISQSGIGVYLPFKLEPGSVVKMEIKDTSLFGIIAYSRSDRSFFRTGIQVVQVLAGGSDLSQLLKATLAEVMPDVQWLETPQ